MTSRPLAEALEEALEHCRDMDASLNTRLRALADAVRTLSPSFAEAVDRPVSRLQQSGGPRGLNLREVPRAVRLALDPPRRLRPAYGCLAHSELAGELSIAGHAHPYPGSEVKR